MISALVPIFYLLIFGVPFSTVTAGFLLAHTTEQRIALAFFSPAIFTFLYILTAGLLSRIGRRAVIPGIFPRDLKHPVYGPRRLYASAWTSVYYFTPIYFIALSVPILKKMMFRLFGYQFDMDFTVYPDTWLRDLTCVKFEKGAYLANKSTIGTNICLSDGRILVDRVKVGEKSVVGHGVIAGPGFNTKEQCEISVGTTFGVRVKILNNVKIGAEAGISHGVVINARVEIDNMAHIGTKATIGEGITIPAGAYVPAGTQLLTQNDAEMMFSKEEATLHVARERAIKSLRKRRETSRVEPIVKKDESRFG